MRYFGGKQRIADDIAKIIDLFRGGRPYLEPFMGGANIITRVKGGIRIGSDVVPELIEMYRAMQNGWVPPNSLSKEEYADLKSECLPTALKGFAAFGCSFAGKYFGGYAASSTRNYAANAAGSLAAKRPGLTGIDLRCASYKSFNPTGCLIYCDPPYAGTTSYARAGAFNSDEFWTTMRRWATQDNTILVSEYVAPSDVAICWEKEVITDIRGKAGKLPRTERLFIL